MPRSVRLLAGEQAIRRINFSLRVGDVFSAGSSSLGLSWRDKHCENEGYGQDVGQKEVEEYDGSKSVFDMRSFVRVPPMVHSLSDGQIVDHLEDDTQKGDYDEKANLGSLAFEEV